MQLTLEGRSYDARLTVVTSPELCFKVEIRNKGQEQWRLLHVDNYFDTAWDAVKYWSGEIHKDIPQELKKYSSFHRQPA